MEEPWRRAAKPPQRTNSKRASARRQVIGSRGGTGLGECGLEGLGMIEGNIMLAKALYMGKAEIFVEKRQVDAKGFGALDSGEVFCLREEGLELRRGHAPIWAV
jgi:hypothetical protein